MAATRIWLDVPYSQKDQAKALGARWGPDVKRWYAPRPNMTLAPTLDGASGYAGPTARVRTVCSTLGCCRSGHLFVLVRQHPLPVLIHASSAASQVDWRTDYTALQYELTGLPVTVEDGIRRYMAAFGLVYAAFDFAIDTAEKWFFLEANTAGQYGFLETNTGAPISNAARAVTTLGLPPDHAGEVHGAPLTLVRPFRRLL